MSMTDDGTHLEHLAEVEPRLLILKAELAAEKITPIEAVHRLRSLVGQRPFDEAWAQHVPPCPKDRDRWWWGLEYWEKAVPLGDPRRRIYSETNNAGPFRIVLLELKLEAALQQVLKAEADANATAIMAKKPARH